MEKVVERFLEYVRINTQSNEEVKTSPSSQGQWELAKKLKNELEEIGLEDVFLDGNCYLMATLPPNTKDDVPVVGFISHLDTSPSITGEGVNPKIVRNYNGEDIVLNKEKNIILSPKFYPELKNYIGEDLIVTDGTTLLGADDKGGIAEIITAMEYLIKHDEIPHGKIRIAFTPDEELGRGANLFDVKRFGAHFSYTIDGGPIGVLQYENFNAAKAIVEIFGLNIHPKEAKNKMKNSILIGKEFLSMLPAHETPSHTEGYEGFFHVISFSGEVEKTRLYFIIRDFDRKEFGRKKKLMKEITNFLNIKYGEGTVKLSMEDQYYNMKEKILPVKVIVDIAEKAMKLSGIKPNIVPVRGGTDGARLSYKGLPTPNIFVGGHNYHGRFEYIPISSMEKAVELIVKVSELIYEKRDELKKVFN